jgi:hypothetical protein
MYGLKQLSILSLMLLSASATKSVKRTIVRISLLFLSEIANKTTQVGIETAEKSRGVDVPLNDCHPIEEESVHFPTTSHLKLISPRDVLTVSLKKPCRLFT